MEGLLPGFQAVIPRRDVRSRDLSAKGLQYTLDTKVKVLERIFRKQKAKTKKLNDLISRNETVDAVQSTYADWLKIYPEFLCIFDEVSILADQAQSLEIQSHIGDMDTFLRNSKVSAQFWLETNCPKPQMTAFPEMGGKSPQIQTPVNPVPEVNPRDSVSCASARRSHASSRMSSGNSLASARLREEKKKAELSARASVIKRKHDIELAKFKLQLESAELELDTQLAIVSAKQKVIDKLAKEETESVNNDRQTHVSNVSQVVSEQISLQQLQAIQHEKIVPENVSKSVLNPTAMSYIPPTSVHNVQSQNVCNFPQSIECVTNQPLVEPAPEQVIQSVVRHLRKPVPEIKKFSGNVLEYRKFIRQFETKICLNTESPDEKLNFLDQFTEGEPNKIVSGFSYIDATIAYPAVRKELEQRYGNDEILANAFVKRALNWPTIKADNTKALDDFSIFLCECGNAVHSIPAIKVLEYPDNMRKLVSKLPYNYQEKWRNVVFQLKSNNQIVQFYRLVDFVKTEVRKATDPVYGKDVLRQEQSPVTGKGKPQVAKVRSSFVTSVQDTPDIPDTPLSQVSKTPEVYPSGKPNAFSKPCLYCDNSNHCFEDCWKFQGKDIKDRLDFLKKRGLCFGCLRQGHMKKMCKSRLTCSKCHGKHPAACHTDNLYGKLESVKHVPNDKATSAYANVPNRYKGAGISQCTMAIIPVVVKLKNSLKCIRTYAFLDPGSSVTFCTQKLMEGLGGHGKKLRITLDTMGPQHTMNTLVVSGLEVCDLQMHNCISLPKVYTKGRIPVSNGQIPTSEDLTNWPHLSDISLPQIDAEVGLLIGNNVPDVYTPLEVRTGTSGTPHATRTRLGWVIWSLVRGEENGSENSEIINVNRTEVIAIQEAEQLCTLDRLVRESINFDFPERISEDRREWSKEDQQFMQSVKESMTLKDGHYYISLPFRDKCTRLPDNFPQAVQRLKGLERKLKKCPKFCSDYTDFMTSLFEKGYAELVPDDEINREDGRTWYIPHHGVYHPRKPDKVRVVFDCSATYQGISLNSMLFQGPDLTNSLVGVLIRFRQEPVALMGDIESMYYQVCVPSSDRDVLRFLWWPNGDLQSEPQIYRMKVHLFGGVSSPSCANAALQQTAKQNTTDVSVAQVVLKNFYVDDCLKSVPTEPEASKLINDLMHLCSKGGFTVTKWVSNSRSVIESIPIEHRAKGVKHLDLKFDSIPSERALGVFWAVETDTLGFRISLRETSNTRRGILSLVSSVYDPLGFASPFILPAKILLQQLCQQSVDWDQPISESQLKVWQEWLTDLPLLEKLEFPRCYKPTDFGVVATCQIHVFADASNQGYGVVVYLRLVNTQNQIHCSLLMAKSRVAPLKQMTTPRMELTAAMVAIRVSTIIQREIEYPLDDVLFWTDSMSVLRYIANDSLRFHTFVANRVAVIREASNIHQWNYIDTKLNPADVASRGMRIGQLLKAEHWFRGPEFLWKPVSEWPNSSGKDNTELTEEDPEVKKVFSTSVESSDLPFDYLLKSCSSWMKMRKRIAWMLRIRQHLRSRVAERKSDKAALSIKTPENGFLTTGEIEEAELSIVKYIQTQHFAEEIPLLQHSTEASNQKLKRSSPINKLDPFLRDGVIRVGGRLDRASLPDTTKHPVILPRRSCVSDLILRDAHHSLGHLGKNSILAKVRQKYWILGASTSIKGLVSKCVTCRKYQAKVVQQKMASLPPDRLTPDEPPFTRVGVDYFGPFLTHRGRSELKRYGVVFTCLNTRAIHLEVAQSLTTDSCINALRRFIARRGVVKVIISDNGSNLVGCEQELRMSIKEWNQSRINNDLMKQKVRWEFNPPAGSHHGGVWERMIRSVRKILFSLMKQQVIRLDDELLTTLFCEVEAILNARPLTEAPVDPNDLQPLTPNHLLLLHSGEQLPPGVFDSQDTYARRRWRQVQYLADQFWSRWVKEYIPLLQARQKWLLPNRNLEVDDIVLIVDNTPRNTWSLARVVNVVTDKKGLVRIVDVKTKSGVLRRPVSKLCLISEANST